MGHTTEYARPLLMVDVVMLTLKGPELQVALVRRGNKDEPFFDRYALPGGFVRVDSEQTALDTAHRVLTEKVRQPPAYIEQLGTYASAQRDPRGWSAAIVYCALVPAESIEKDTPVRWVDVATALKEGLPFDHESILADAVQRLRSKTSYSALPIHFMPPTFTMSALREVYEHLLNCELEPRSFARRIEDMDILEETGTLKTDRHRPAREYRAKVATPFNQLPPAIGFGRR